MTPRASLSWTFEKEFGRGGAFFQGVGGRTCHSGGVTGDLFEKDPLPNSRSRSMRTFFPWLWLGKPTLLNGLRHLVSRDYYAVAPSRTPPQGYNAEVCAGKVFVFIKRSC